MPLPRKELKKIEKTHQVRPYLVVYKDRFHIYAYKSSSKQDNWLNNYQEYLINKARYNQNKDSFINLKETQKIPFINFKSKHITLNSFDLKNIQKRLRIQNAEKQYQFNVDIHISDGDVIEIKNQLYYVYTCDNVYLYCLKIYRNIPNSYEEYVKIIINNKAYFTNFKDKEGFKRSVPINVVNIASRSEIEKILEQKNQIKFNKKKLAKNKHR